MNFVGIQNMRPGLTLKVIVTIFLIGLTIGSSYVFFPTVPPVRDLEMYWRSVTFLTSSRCPYDISHQIGLRPTVLQIWIPPFSLLLLTPLSLLPLVAVKEIYRILLALYFGVMQMHRLWICLPSSECVLRQRLAVLLLLTTLGLAELYLFYDALIWGPLTWVSTLFVMAGAHLALHGSVFLPATFLLAALYKPHLYGVPIVCLLIMLMMRRHYKVCIAFCAFAVAIVGVSILLFPQSYSCYYAGIIRGGIFRQEVLQNAVTMVSTMAGFVARFDISCFMVASCLITAVGLVLGVVYTVAFNRQASLSESQSWFILILGGNMFFTPYAWWHDYLACLPAVSLGIQLLVERSNSKGILKVIIPSIGVISAIFLCTSTTLFVGRLLPVVICVISLLALRTLWMTRGLSSINNAANS